MLVPQAFVYWGEFPPPWWDRMPDWVLTFACCSVDTTGRIRAWGRIG
jgi:hypothetical protein